MKESKESKESKLIKISENMEVSQNIILYALGCRPLDGSKDLSFKLHNLKLSKPTIFLEAMSNPEVVKAKEKMLKNRNSETIDEFLEILTVVKQEIRENRSDKENQ